MRYTFAILSTVAAGWAADPGEAAREILQRRCVSCHGPKTKVSGLDLSARETALRGGTRGPALNPGQAAASLLVNRVARGEMPPTGALSKTEQETLRRWVEAGAAWSEPIRERRAGLDWWSLQPLSKAAVPRPPGVPAEWARSAIDAWIHQGLAARGLRPSAPAGRRALVRRLTFDLTGLPPTPEQTGEFIADASPGAYERLVDRLLASPHYGERWGRHWLDVVRYAESEGFERDLLREHAWPYRDWVVRSLNEDKPYVEFAREQIAGDVMEPATRDGVTATSFLVMGPVDAVGLTSAVESERDQVRQDYLEEMVGTVSQTFLGLTLNCARCHDHKFDPIPQRDFYRVKAAFEAVWPPTKGDEFFPSGRWLASPEEVRAREEAARRLRARLEVVESELAEIRRKGWPGRVAASVPAPYGRWTFDTDTRDEMGRLHLDRGDDARVDQGRLRPAQGKDTVTLATPALERDIREKTLEAWLWVEKAPDKSITVLQIRNRSGYRGAAVDGIQYAGGAKRQWENISTAGFRAVEAGGPPEDSEAGRYLHVAIVYGGDDTIRIYRNGVAHGKTIRGNVDIPAAKLQTYRGGDAIMRFSAGQGFGLEEARLYDRALTAEQVAASFGAGAPEYSEERALARLTGAERDRRATLKQEAETLREKIRSTAEPERVHAASAESAPPTHLLIRGDVTRKGEVVTPGALSPVAGLSPELALETTSDDAERRRRLARWIASENNPLFARVMVNRVWHHHFGAGLVATPNDFGFNGGAPSHPELLDWLSAELIRDGWSLKKLHRRIVLSQAYRQSSTYEAAAAAQDSDNRYLWRFPPRRLEGEAVRDAMLAASGALNLRLGGPSFRPFEAKPQGAYQNYTHKDTDDPEFHRRTLYAMNVNSAGNPMLESLDCPLPSVKTPKRPATTTALQSLSLMNNAFANRQARLFARRVASEAGPRVEAQVERAFRLALGRAPRPDEVAPASELASAHGLEALCWGLFNTTEFLYVE